MIAPLGRLLAATPAAPQYRVADRLGDIAFGRLDGYRANVVANLDRATTGGPQRDQMARAVFRTAARNFVDLARSPYVALADRARSTRLVEGDWDILGEALGRDRGVIVVSAHLGPFDQIPAILAGRGLRVTALTTRTTGRRAFALATRLRRAHGVGVAEPDRTVLRGLTRHLGGGGCVGLVADCDLVGTGTPVRFFGRPTTLPSVAVRLARTTGAPIVPVFVRREPGGIAVSIRDAVVVERSGDPAGDVALGMEQIVLQLERAITRSPEQWVIFRQVWPASDDGTPDGRP